MFLKDIWDKRNKQVLYPQGIKPSWATEHFVEIMLIAGALIIIGLFILAFAISGQSSYYYYAIPSTV